MGVFQMFTPLNLNSGVSLASAVKKMLMFPFLTKDVGTFKLTRGGSHAGAGICNLLGTR